MRTHSAKGPFLIYCCNYFRLFSYDVVQQIKLDIASNDMEIKRRTLQQFKDVYLKLRREHDSASDPVFFFLIYLAL